MGGITQEDYQWRWLLNNSTVNNLMVNHTDNIPFVSRRNIVDNFEHKEGQVWFESCEEGC